MGKTVVFVGGAAGTGTTSVINLLRDLHPEFHFYNPRMHYGALLGGVSLADVRASIVESFSFLPEGVTLVDWPYARQTETGEFESFLSWGELQRIGEREEIGSFILVQLYVDPVTLLERRRQDCAAEAKRGSLNFDQIAHEIGAAMCCYNETADALCDRIVYRWANLPLRIENTDLGATVRKIDLFVKVLSTAQAFEQKMAA